MSDWTNLLARFSPFQCIFARATESVNLAEGRGYEPPYNLEYVVILYSNEKCWLLGITGLIYHQFDGTRLSGDAIFSYILPTLCRSYQRPRVNKDSSTTVSSYTDNNCGSLLIPTLILLCLWKASICYSAQTKVSFVNWTYLHANLSSLTLSSPRPCTQNGLLCYFTL